LEERMRAEKEALMAQTKEAEQKTKLVAKELKKQESKIEREKY
jgi:hypothetical protein